MQFACFSLLRCSTNMKDEKIIGQICLYIHLSDVPNHNQYRFLSISFDQSPNISKAHMAKYPTWDCSIPLIYWCLFLLPTWFDHLNYGPARISSIITDNSLATSIGNVTILPQHSYTQQQTIYAYALCIWWIWKTKNPQQTLQNGCCICISVARLKTVALHHLLCFICAYCICVTHNSH